MIRTCEVSFNLPLRHVDAFTEFAARLSLSDYWAATPEIWIGRLFTKTFEYDDPRIPAIREFVQQHHVGGYMQVCDASYTHEELCAAPLLELLAVAINDEITRSEAEMYDFSTGCPVCRAGTMQIKPFIIRTPSRLPRRSPLCNVGGVYLIARPLYEGLAALGLRGAELLQVEGSRSGPLPWWQIMPRHTMSPMSAEQTGYSRDAPDACAVCGRNSWAPSVEEDVPQIAYRRSELGDGPLPDIATTWECYGTSSFEGNTYNSVGFLLVSPRVYEVFHQLRVPKVRFSPVKIVEDR